MATRVESFQGGFWTTVGVVVALLLAGWLLAKR